MTVLEIMKAQYENIRKNGAKTRQKKVKPEKAAKAVLTDEQKAFLDTKGPLFRKLWTKRLQDGMHPNLSNHLEEMLEEFRTTQK